MGQTDFDHGFNVAVDKDDDRDRKSSDECMSPLVCVSCGRRHGYCSEVNVQLTGVYYHPSNNPGISPEEWENRNMINRTSSEQSQQKGARQGKRRNGLPFLSTAEATNMHQPGKIIAARVEADTFRPGGEVVALKIQFRGQFFLYNLRTNNPVLEELCNSFGNDESQWTGKNISVFNEEDSFNGKTWLRLEATGDDQPLERTETKRPGRK